VLDLDLRGPADDVVVGHDQAIGRPDHAGAVPVAAADPDGRPLDDGADPGQLGGEETACGG
jgi:hypothetical protein